VLRLFLVRGWLGLRLRRGVLVSGALANLLGQLARVKRRSGLALKPFILLSDLVNSLVRLPGTDALCAGHRFRMESHFFFYS
jgi:hypothetical protein